MKRTSKKIQLLNVRKFKSKLFDWSQQFEEIAWLDSNNYEQHYSSYDLVLAIDAHTVLQTNYNNAFDQLQRFKNEVNDYIFGYLGYDLKNDIEALTSKNLDGLDFTDLYFFQPKKIFFLKGNELEIQYLKLDEQDIESDLKSISNIIKPTRADVHEVKIHKRITKPQYLEQLKKILDHIHRGDIYEVNFCQEFYAENASINPFEVYKKLNKISNPPFASFLRIDRKYVLSASPERFVRKQQQKIISQPIKGTAKRLSNRRLDQKLAQDLALDEKERSENIMIVDLVRNDLSKTANKGSVKVEELCKVYSFDQVHQLISTIVSEVPNEIDAVTIVKSLFPMGSMTGAPKVSAMQIIETLESTKRGLYSGAIGYFTPTNDFDFNVVIRSILYNETQKYLSYSVGGAITSKSNPEKEYQECLLKAIAMKTALKN